MVNPSRHPVLQALARFGDFARGAIFILVGVISAEAAIFLGGRSTGAVGALRAVVTKPHGRVAVAVVAAGLLADALYRFAQAAFLRSRGALRRIGYVFRGCGALFLGAAVARILMTPRIQRDRSLLREWSARVLAHPWGRNAVLAVGIVLIFAGAREIFLGATGGFRLPFGSLKMGRSVKKWSARLSRFGLAAHGFLLLVLGVFAARAAIDLDPRELVETGGALSALGKLPYGSAWLFGIAAGLMAYGFSLWIAAIKRRKG